MVVTVDGLIVTGSLDTTAKIYDERGMGCNGIHSQITCWIQLTICIHAHAHAYANAYIQHHTMRVQGNVVGLWKGTPGGFKHWRWRRIMKLLLDLWTPLQRYGTDRQVHAYVRWQATQLVWGDLQVQCSQLSIFHSSRLPFILKLLVSDKRKSCGNCVFRPHG